MAVAPAAFATCTAKIEASPIHCVSTTPPSFKGLMPYRAFHPVGWAGEVRGFEPVERGQPYLLGLSR